MIYLNLNSVHACSINTILVYLLAFFIGGGGGDLVAKSHRFGIPWTVASQAPKSKANAQTYGSQC